MNDLLDALKRGVAAAALRAAIAAAGLFLVALCVCGVFAFGLFAFYLHAAQQMSPASAAGATAGIALALALILGGSCALALRIAARPQRPPATARPAQPRLPLRGEAMVDRAELWIARNPRAAIVGAFAAGGVLGLSPQLRKAVAEAIVAAVSPPPPPRDR